MVADGADHLFGVPGQRHFTFRVAGSEESEESLAAAGFNDAFFGDDQRLEVFVDRIGPAATMSEQLLAGPAGEHRQGGRWRALRGGRINDLDGFAVHRVEHRLVGAGHVESHPADLTTMANFVVLACGPRWSRWWP